MPTPEDFPRRWFPLRMRVADSEAERLWKCDKRFIGCDAGRQSYKTELGKRKLVMSLIPTSTKDWNDPRFFYAAPTKQQARLIAWNDLKALVPKRWIRDPEHDINETDNIIRTGFGSELHVVGMDKPERIEGKTWDGGVLDECSDIRWDKADRAILPMLAARNGWLWKLGVPKRSGIGAAHFREYCEKARRGEDPETAAFTWPSSDVMLDNQLRWYWNNWDAMDVAEQFGGVWQTVGGDVWHAYDEDYNVRACEFDPGAQLIVTCDFNVEPMAWALGHPREGVPPQGYTEWFNEIWLHDANTQKALDVLWEQYGKHTHGTISFYGDATSRRRETSASESDYLQILNDKRFKAKGATVHFPKANPARADRFASGNAVLRNAAGNVRTLIDPRCEHLLIDMRTRGWVDSGEIGHMSDAWSYYCYLVFPLQQQKGKTEIRIRTTEHSGNNKPTSRPRVRRRHARAR